MWGAWVSSTEQSADAVANQFNIWQSIEPENFIIDRDSSDVTDKVWVTGAHANAGDPGTGWVFFNDAGDPNFEKVITPTLGGPLLPEEFLDRPDSTNGRKKKKFGHAYMAAKAGTVVTMTWDMTYDPQHIQLAGGISTWRPGQTVYITSNTAHGLSDYPLEVRQVDVDLLNANGQTQFSISAGALPYSGLRKIRSRGAA